MQVVAVVVAVAVTGRRSSRLSPWSSLREKSIGTLKGCPGRRDRQTQSVSSRSPRAHHTVSTDGSAPSVNTSTEYSLARATLGLLNFATVRSVSPSKQGDPWCSLPYTTGRDCDRQSGGGWGRGGWGWGWGCVNRRHTSAVVVLPHSLYGHVYGPCVGRSASFNHVDHPRADLYFRRQPARRDFRIG